MVAVRLREVSEVVLHSRRFVDHIARNLNQLIRVFRNGRVLVACGRGSPPEPGVTKRVEEELGRALETTVNN